MFSTFPPDRRRFFAVLLLPLVFSGCAFLGCGRFSPLPQKKYVYVSIKEMFLRDRLAAVSTRVAEVKNGEHLEVVSEDRRFYRVKTASGAIGWIDDRAVIDQQTYDEFAALQKEHIHDPVVVTGVLRDESNVHLAPGRDEVHFYMLPANAKLQLLMRASVPKPVPSQAVPVPLPLPKKKTAVKVKKEKKRDPNAPPYVPGGPPMEDWWLVRGPQGQMGWVLSRMIDINIPQELDGLAGEQRYIGAYRLRTVDDPESKFPNGQAPEYVAVTNAWNDGLPYDFDQIHVFTWDTRRHRYELAFRDRDIEGYLPVTIGSMTVNGQSEPTFSFKVATDNNDMAFDPATGAARAAHTTTVTYRLEGDLVKKVGPPEPAASKIAAATPAKTEKRHRRGARAKEHRKRRRR
jgi:hypothetical protein